MALAGDLQGHGPLPFPGVFGQGGQVEVGEQGEVLRHHPIGQLLELGIHRERILLEAHGVAQALAHLLDAIKARQDRQQHPELGPLAEVPLQVAAHGHIELLVGAAQLQVGLDRHRVVALQQGIEKLVQGDRRARAVAVGEVFLGQHLTHGGDPQ